MERVAEDLTIVFRKMTDQAEVDPNTRLVLDSCKELEPIRVLAEAVNLINTEAKASYSTSC